MTRMHCRKLAFWALALALTLIPTQRSESQSVNPKDGPPSNHKFPPTATGWQQPQSAWQSGLVTEGGLVCKFYPLAELGDDPAFGQWVADTIPRVIEPGTWGQGGNAKRIFYSAPPGKNAILVVCHTPAVQTQVTAFLDGLKKAMQTGQAKAQTPAGQAAAHQQALIPAQHLLPSSTTNAEPVPGTGAYPVPAQKQHPKHLFHFIIRYEGEGIVDSNVVELMKAQFRAAKSATCNSEGPTASYQPTAIPPAGMGITGSGFMPAGSTNMPGQASPNPYSASTWQGVPTAPIQTAPIPAQAAPTPQPVMPLADEQSSSAPQAKPLQPVGQANLPTTSGFTPSVAPSTGSAQPAPSVERY